MIRCNCGFEIIATQGLESDGLTCPSCGEQLQKSKPSLASQIEVRKEAMTRRREKEQRNWLVFPRWLAPYQRLWWVSGSLNQLSGIEQSITYETTGQAQTTGFVVRGTLFANTSGQARTKRYVRNYITYMNIGGYSYTNMPIANLAYYEILRAGGWVSCIFTRDGLNLVMNHTTRSYSGSRPSNWRTWVAFIAALLFTYFVSSPVLLSEYAPGEPWWSTQVHLLAGLLGIIASGWFLAGIIVSSIRWKFLWKALMRENMQS